MMERLNGWKSYIIAGLMIAVVVAQQIGWLTAETAAAIEAILLGGLGMSLRHAIAKTGGNG